MTPFQTSKSAELQALGWSPAGKRFLGGRPHRKERHAYLFTNSTRLRVYVYPDEVLYFLES